LAKEAPCLNDCANRIWNQHRRDSNETQNYLSRVLEIIYDHESKSRIVQIEDVTPAAMQGVILTAEFNLTKLYHATQSATHAL